MQDLANIMTQPHAISDDSAAVLAGHSKAVRDREVSRRYNCHSEKESLCEKAGVHRQRFMTHFTFHLVMV